MEIYTNGEIKIRLGDGIFMAVKAATKVTYLQQAVEVNVPNGRMYALGQINRTFSVQPDVDLLLDELSGVTVSEPQMKQNGLEGLESLDTD